MDAARPFTPIPPAAVTLGLLAGGRARRLGGLDKAWLRRAGVPQVVRLSARIGDDAGPRLVSTNAGAARFVHEGFEPVADRHPGLGPLGGLEALAHACRTPWLLTLPVDLVSVNDCLLATLAAAGDRGAVAEDDDGLQPLVALWPADALRAATAAVLMSEDRSVQALQRSMGVPRVRFAGLRFGNLNTPADLQAAGIDVPEGRRE